MYTFLKIPKTFCLSNTHISFWNHLFVQIFVNQVFPFDWFTRKEICIPNSGGQCGKLLQGYQNEVWGGGAACFYSARVIFLFRYLVPAFFPSLFCFTYQIPLTKTICKIVINRGPWMKLINIIGPLKRLLYRLNQFDLNFKHFSSKIGRYYR